MVSQLLMDSLLMAAGIGTLSDRQLKGLRDAKIIKSEESTEGEDFGARVIGGTLVLFGLSLVLLSAFQMM